MSEQSCPSLRSLNWSYDVSLLYVGIERQRLFIGDVNIMFTDELLTFSHLSREISQMILPTVYCRHPFEVKK